MHIILGALGTIVTILILVHRLSDSGIDIGWLNPFAWKRRREWAKKYNANPVYSLTSPMEATAVLMLAMAKSEGELSAEQKKEIISKFRETFSLSEEMAASLFTSASFLQSENAQLLGSIKKVLEPNIDNFSEEQAMSALQLITHIANFDSVASMIQQQAINTFKAEFKGKFVNSGEWV